VCFDVQYTGISFNVSVIKDNLNLVILLLKICDFKVCKNLDAPFSVVMRRWWPGYVMKFRMNVRYLPLRKWVQFWKMRFRTQCTNTHGLLENIHRISACRTNHIIPTPRFEQPWRHLFMMQRVFLSFFSRKWRVQCKPKFWSNFSSRSSYTPKYLNYTPHS